MRTTTTNPLTGRAPAPMAKPAMRIVPVPAAKAIATTPKSRRGGGMLGDAVTHLTKMHKEG